MVTEPVGARSAKERLTPQQRGEPDDMAASAPMGGISTPPSLGRSPRVMPDELPAEEAVTELAQVRAGDGG